MSQPDQSVPASEVRAHLERLLTSRTLAGSDQLKRLLRLVVERTLDGQSGLLKEFNLGLEAFQRPPDYDPKIDPIVRVQARRLRAKLEEYYAGEGAQETLVVQIPKGAYVPVIERRKASMQPVRPQVRLPWVVAAVGAAIAAVLAVAWLSRAGGQASADIQRGIAVLPIKMFTADASRGHIADQVTEALTTELSKNKQLRVLSRTTASRYRETKASLPEIARALEVRWVVEGGVGLEGNRAYIKLRAVDSVTDRKVWADVFDCDLDGLTAVNAKAAAGIAAAVESQLVKAAAN